MISIVMISLTLLFGCEDKIIQEGVGELVLGQDNLEACSDETIFDGLESISDIRDNTVSLSWQEKPESLGYSIFQLTAENQLKLVDTISAGSSTYIVNDLSAETNYSFMVKSIDEDGLNDCNKKLVSVTTAIRETFKSCLDIQTFYGNTEPSGSYEIDVDLEGPKEPFNVYCEMDLNGGGWTRIFVHKVTGGVFASKDDAKEKNTDDINADLYSQLIHLEDFNRSGEFEFWLNYSELDGNSGGNRWTQTSNPLFEEVSGYNATSVDHTSRYWGGLEPDTGSNSLIDGSVGHSNWYYAVGAINYWPSSGTIPGSTSGVNEVMLYIR